MTRAAAARRLQTGAAVVLAIGLSIAAWIYVNAAGAPPDDVVQQFLGSKRYLHDVRTYGGNISVIADEMSRWFSGLWHGEKLAGTIAVISIVFAAILFIAGRSTARSTGNATGVATPAEPSGSEEK